MYYVQEYYSFLSEEYFQLYIRNEHLENVKINEDYLKYFLRDYFYQ